MFNQLTNLGFQRTWLQALGFYIAYLLLVIVLGGLAGGVAGIMNGGGSFQIGLKYGTIAAVIAVFTLALLILNAKKNWQFGYILLAILAPLLAIVGGGLLGLIPVAYLTTRPSKTMAQTPTSSN